MTGKPEVESENRKQYFPIPEGENRGEKGLSYLIDTLLCLSNIIPPGCLGININNPLHSIIQLPKPKHFPDTQPLLRFLRTSRSIFFIPFLFRRRRHLIRPMTGRRSRPKIRRTRLSILSLRP